MTMLPNNYVDLSHGCLRFRLRFNVIQSVTVWEVLNWHSWQVVKTANLVLISANGNKIHITVGRKLMEVYLIGTYDCEFLY